MTRTAPYLPEAPAAAGTLSVSVVVPSYRRPQLLARCLEHLLQQDFPREDYEIIVADDGPDQDTYEVVEACALFAGGKPLVRYLPVRGTQGPAAARNAGWRLARGRVIAFTDDDTQPLRGWLREGLSAMHGGVVAVSGAVRVPLGPEPSDYERDTAGLECAEFVTANCFVRREALDALGGFDERFTSAWREDSDLQFRLLGLGHIVRAPRAIVRHPVRAAVWGVALRQQRKVYFDALLYKKHPQLYRARIRRAPRWDYYFTVAALIGAPLAFLCGLPALAAGAALVWLGLSVNLCRQRLRDTSRKPLHVIETVLTSLAIPPLATWWRLRGAWHFRVLFL
jgi:glycosyltransferase involved in cell wall biosynthesis